MKIVPTIQWQDIIKATYECDKCRRTIDNKIDLIDHAVICPCGKGHMAPIKETITVPALDRREW